MSVASLAPVPSSTGYGLGQNFACALAIGVAAILCTFAFLAFILCRYLMTQNQGFPDACQTTKTSSRFSLENIPVLRPSELTGKSFKGGESCAVCLGELSRAEHVEMQVTLLRLLPRCGHCFHCECVDEWLQSHNQCPVCRTTLFENESANSSCNPTGSPEERAEVCILVQEAVQNSNEDK